MSLWCIICSGILLELDEDLYRVFLLVLYVDHNWDLLQSFWMSWRTPMRGWSLMWYVMMIMINTGVMASQGTPIVVCTLHVMWPAMASVGGVMTMASISAWLELQPWSAVLVSVPVMVSRSWSGVMPGVGSLSMMMCKCAWWGYPMWTVHYYMTIFIAFKTLYIWTVSFYMTLLLTLETSVIFMRHYIYYGCR